MARSPTAAWDRRMAKEFVKADGMALFFVSNFTRAVASFRSSASIVATADSQADECQTGSNAGPARGSGLKHNGPIHGNKQQENVNHDPPQRCLKVLTGAPRHADCTDGRGT